MDDFTIKSFKKELKKRPDYYNIRIMHGENLSLLQVLDTIEFKASQLFLINNIPLPNNIYNVKSLLEYLDSLDEEDNIITRDLMQSMHYIIETTILMEKLGV